MKLQQQLIYYILLLIITSCGGREMSQDAENKSLPVAWNQAVFYEIFVQSFADSDGDGIGDINGMTSKLDYLKDLGIDAIWLMPMSPSPSYHKYDVTDYLGIHPDYGTIEDFKAFIQAAHQKNIKVVMDFVINHSGYDHPWFQNAMQGKNAKYRDYYVWADKDSIVEQMAKKVTSFDSDNIRQWHPVNGDSTKEHYYGFFYGGMPDLNYDNPAVRAEMYEAGKFWLTDVGVDGFRLDAAKHIYPDDRAEDSHAFWKEFKTEMEKINPDVYLIGEVWADANTASPYAAGFTSLFNFDRAFSILESINKERVVAANIAGHSYQIDSTANLADVINTSLPWFEKYNQNFVEASFLSNHDQNRVASVLGNDQSKIKLAASMLFTLPGTPYIYYGEEIGMLGLKPDENIREPMVWDADELDGARTSWMQPVYTTATSVEPAMKQVRDDQSLLSHYKSLISLKKRDVFSLGDIQNLDFGTYNIVAFTRNYGETSAAVVHNLSNQKVELGAQTLSDYSSIVWSQGEVSKSQSALILPARGSVVLLK
ncbi:MAG: alpha-amylase family glycosyl hydrolase [Reichenbachiella sp.]|uniref:alpha-amylase family glycosyl hydrolase n=1 Tax=Reichenbachiella sp. TaxID=2184521 RepID=UPI003263A0A0